MAGEPQKEFIDKLKALTGNTVVGYSANDSLVTAIAKIAATLDHPARFYASETPDEYLNFTGFSTVKGDGTAKVLPPDSNGASGVLLTSGKVSLKTGTVVGTTPLLLASGAAFSLPATTAGQYRRLAIKQTATAFYAVFGAAYSGTYSYAALEDPGTLWLQAPGTPVCFIDLQAYSNSGATAFKTALSSTNVVENNVGGTAPMIYEVANVSDRGRLVVNQDRNLRLVNGGNWRWTATTSTLTWSAAAQIEVPGVATSANNIPAGSLVVADDQVIYVDINRLGSGGNITLVAAAASSVSVSDNRTVIGYRTGTSLYLGINSSILYADGDNRPIGALVNVSSSQEYDAGVFDSDLVTIDLSKGVAQKFQLTNPNAQIKLINGIVGVTYTVRGYFDGFIPYNGALGLHANAAVSGQFTQNLTTEPYGQFIILATCTLNNEYLINISNYDGVVLKTPVDSVPQGFSLGGTSGFLKDGKLFLWGSNTYGQLGNGGTVGRSIPSDPVSLPFSVSKASIGNGYVAVLDPSTGQAWMWGYSPEGRLGDGTVTSSSSPVSVLGGRSFSEISCGNCHTVALEGSTGLAWAWGNNNNAKLGNNTSTGNVSSPVSVVGGRSFTKIFASNSSCYAIEGSTGAVWAWGSNTQGQLGNFSTAAASSPVSVFGGRSFKDLSVASSSVLAIEASTGLAWGWGNNYAGQLGSGTAFTPVAVSSPVSVVGGRSWKKIVGGYSGTYNYSAFVGLEASSGKVYAWGEGDSGITGTLGWRSSPTLLNPKSHSLIGMGSDFYDATSSSADVGLALGVESGAGALYTWNTSFSPELGKIYEPYPLEPRIFLYNKSYKFSTTEGQTFRQVALEASTGYAYCWGSSFTGGGTNSDSMSSPVSVLGGRSYRFATSGYNTSLAIEGSTGYAWTWGVNYYSTLGNGNYNDAALSPVSVLGERSYSKAAALSYMTVAIEASTGLAWAWGLSTRGIGTGNTQGASSPVSVLGGRSYSDVAGYNQTAALIEGSTGYIWMFGDNTYGTLGNNSQAAASSPVSVLGARSYSKIQIDNHVAVAIEGSTGYAWGWGYQNVGDGTTQQRSSPASVIGGRSYSNIVCFAGNVLAFEASTGLAWAWGTGSYLGTGKASGESSPVSVLGGRSFSQIMPMGGSAPYVVAQDGATGSYYIWGEIAYSVLAPRRVISTYVPRRITSK